MEDRQVKIDKANFAQVQSGDGAVSYTIIVRTPEEAAAVKMALEQGKDLESQGIQGVVHNLPFARNINFTGREDIIERIQSTLSNDSAAAITQPQAIHGLGGIGKSQIAMEYAYRYLSDFKYIFWIEAENDATLSKSFTQLGSILGLPQVREKDKSLLFDAVRQWIERHRNWLLIFDNAEEARSLHTFLPRSQSGQVIITTRSSAMSGVAKSVEVDEMDPDSAVEFLLKRATIAKPTDDQNSSAQGICKLLGNLPLAIDHAGAFIEVTGASLPSYKEHIERHGIEVLADEQYASATYDKTVATTWSISIEKRKETNPAAVMLLTAASFLAPDDIPIELFTTGHEHLSSPLKEVAADEYKIAQALGDLQRFSLVRRQQGEKTFSMHRLVQSVIRDSLSEDQRKELLHGMIDCLSSVTPDVTDFKNWPTLEALFAHASALFAESDAVNLQSETLGNLLNQFGFYLDDRADYSAAEPLYQRALDIAEKALGREHPDVGIRLNNLAVLYDKQGRYEEAVPLAKRALKITEKALGPEHPDVGTWLNNLAHLHNNQGRYGEAEPLYQRALKITEKALGPEHPDVGICLNNLALSFKRQERYGDAEPLYQRALNITEKSLGEDHPDVGIRLNNLAALYDSLERYSDAEPLYQRALKITEKALGSEHPDVGIRLNNLAGLYNTQGRYDEAEPLYQRAYEIFRMSLRADHPNTISLLENIAMFYHKWGKKDKAAKYDRLAEQAKAKK